MAELKPCPFCGGEMSLVYTSKDNAFYVFHKTARAAENCPIDEMFKITRLKVKSLSCAADAWNRRADNG